jgi:hypothetical protein
MKLKWILDALRFAAELVKPAKELHDVWYEAKYGMTLEEAKRRKADIDRRHKQR